MPSASSSSGSSGSTAYSEDLESSKTATFDEYSSDEDDSSSEMNSALEVEIIRRNNRLRYNRIMAKEPSHGLMHSKFSKSFSHRVDYAKKWFHGIGSKIRNAEHSRHHPMTKTQVWRYRLGEFLESHKVQAVLLILLLLDIIVVAFILAIELSAFGDPHHGDPHTAEQWLHWIGLSLLCIFLLEKVLLVISFGWLFFTHIGYVFDTAVIITAIVMKFLHAEDGTGLIIILRAWRVFMIVHALYEELHHYVEHLHHKLHRKKRFIRRQREYIDYLESKVGITPGMGRIIDESTHSDSSSDAPHQS